MGLGARVRSFNGREDYLRALAGAEVESCRELEHAIAVRFKDQDSFELTGICSVDSQVVEFLVDRQWGATQGDDGVWLPNWRERLECPICELNCRQRFLASLVLSDLEVRADEGAQAPVLYMMEQVTPMFGAFASRLGERCIGSEFLGPDVALGSVHDGLRHEDAENLSFADDSLDVVVSNDVLEHVEDPREAVAEVARVLKPGGVFLFSIPFDTGRDQTRTRARIVDGEIEHIEPPEFHGNPISDEGSLVFTDFGWDFLDHFQALGFAECRPTFAWSLTYGFLGPGSLVFRARL